MFYFFEFRIPCQNGRFLAAGNGYREAIGKGCSGVPRFLRLSQNILNLRFAPGLIGVDPLVTVFFVFLLDNDTNSGIIEIMADIKKILKNMRLNPRNIRFSDICKVCDYYFGEPRQKGTSHRIYKATWIYPPLKNIQDFKGKVKEYQVKHTLDAIDKLEEEQ